MGENPIVKVRKHISSLSELNKAGREQEFKRWKEAGLMDEKTIEAFEKLISDEHSKERNERIGGKAKKIGLVAALLMALSVWAAAKKAGADNQMGVH